MHPPPARPQAPRYVQKADYGKVPGYLQHNKAQIAKEKARQDALLLAAEEVPLHLHALICMYPILQDYHNPEGEVLCDDIVAGLQWS